MSIIKRVPKALRVRIAVKKVLIVRETLCESQVKFNNCRHCNETPQIAEFFGRATILCISNKTGHCTSNFVMASKADICLTRWNNKN